MFPEDMKKVMAGKFTVLLAELVESIEDPHSLTHKLRMLGPMHVKRGVQVRILQCCWVPCCRAWQQLGQRELALSKSRSVAGIFAAAASPYRTEACLLEKAKEQGNKILPCSRNMH